ncbi:cob(I)alamin adenolsyltransferase/cobinamide ATP-dependent adenolsyltransferase [Clostridia bacterium]|nr:cob(I)alamin adenolsyltransferase/cobinamide ATP-dependent adenolsyltransferase [Clostridia bacterium]
MGKGSISVYYGEGKGKSSSAVGYAVRVAAMGKSSIIIQFLKEKKEGDEYRKRLEPEIRFFRFEKSSKNFDDLSEEEKYEEAKNIKNGFQFAKKVLQTGDCDVLILDEFLGLLDHHLMTKEELKLLIAAKSEETEMIFTGRVMNPDLEEYVNCIYHIKAERCDTECCQKLD